MTKRVTMQLDPVIFEQLKEWKDSIHELASRKRAPMSWNTFFLLVMTDWQNSMCKCHCGKIYTCDACSLSCKLMSKKAHSQLSDLE